MAGIEDFGDFETAWCPGCGNFSILKAVKQALAGRGLRPRDVLMVSGIGQAAKAPHYLNANVFNGLHGRARPAPGSPTRASPSSSSPATGARRARAETISPPSARQSPRR